MSNEKEDYPYYQEHYLIPGIISKKLGQDGLWKLHIRWGRLFGIVAAIVLISYITLTSALYVYLKHKRDYDYLSYWRTLAIPFAYTSFVEDMGDHQIEKAIEAFDNKEYTTAFPLFRSGLQRSPHHSEGRIYYSKFYGSRRYQMAIEILEHDLMSNLDHQEYLSTYFSYLLNFNQDEKAIEKASTLIGKVSDKKIQQLIAYFAASAHAYRGHFDKAEDYIAQYKLTRTIDGYLLDAKITWERGNQQAAIDKLETGMNTFSDRIAFYHTLTQYHLSMKNYDQARRYCLLRETAHPEAFGPRIDLLYVYSSYDEKDRKVEELDSLLNDFADESKAMLMLSNYAVFDKNLDLALRLYERSVEKSDWDSATFASNVMRTAIAAGKYEETIEFGENILNERPKWLEEHRHIFGGFLSIAYFGNGNKNLSDVYLKELMKNRDERANVLIGLANSFEQVGAMQHARQILLEAHKSNARNQQVLSELIRIDLAMGNSSQLSDYLNKMLQMRRPSRDILLQAYHELASDRFIFARDRENLLIELRTLLGKDA